MILIKADQVSKRYLIGDIESIALKNVSFTIQAGSFAAVVGPSGSGKSTLLNLIGCLDHPSGGNLEVCSTQVSALSRTEAAKFRGDNIGFIFQDFNLIPVLTVFENVEYPLLFVHPDEQGKGYGKRLMEYARDKKHMDKVDVNEQNEKALQFYLHLGFQIIGRDETDSMGKPFPILHLQLPEADSANRD